MITSRHQGKLFLLILLLIFASLSSSAATNSQPNAVLLQIHGAVGPATADYIHRGIALANEQQAEFIILQLDTPGGLDKSMRNIIRDIMNSTIPIISYVAPSGARAASAGTFIVYASHIAAMAPGTNLGAATPINLLKAMEKVKNTQPSSEENKAINDAKAYIRSLAQLRNRNVTWAENSVNTAASLSANEALKQNVINFIATDIPDLLKKLNNQSVEIQNKTKLLTTSNIHIQTLTPDWRTEFLAIITDPTIAYILLLLGIYGLIFEFINPGFILPGLIGIISLLLALYALQLLPINYVGLALIIVGLGSMLGELFITSGALIIGGLIAFFVGSIMLFDSASSGLHIALSVILAISIATAIIFLITLRLAIKSRFRPIVSGGDVLLGASAKIIKDEQGIDRIQLQGELWQVKSDSPLSNGQKVKVIKRDGLTLIVVAE